MHGCVLSLPDLPQVHCRKLVGQFFRDRNNECLGPPGRGRGYGEGEPDPAMFPAVGQKMPLQSAPRILPGYFGLRPDFSIQAPAGLRAKRIGSVRLRKSTGFRRGIASVGRIPPVPNLPVLCSNEPTENVRNYCLSPSRHCKHFRGNRTPCSRNYGISLQSIISMS